jgi:hypothetical protein
MPTLTDPDEDSRIQDLYDQEFATPSSSERAEAYKKAAGDNDQGEGTGFYNPNDTSAAEREAYGRAGASAGELKAAEHKADGTLGSGYRNEPAGKVSRLRGFLKKKAKKWLILAGAPVIAVIVALILLFTFANSLKIVNLAEHVAAWQFARTARNLSEHTAAITTEDALISAGEKESTLSLKNFPSKVWGSMTDSINKYNPNAIVDKLDQKGRIKFESKRLPGNLWKKKYTAIILDDKRIPVGSTAWNKLFHPNLSRQIRLQGNASINAWISESAMSGRGPIIRGLVAKEIRSRYGISLKWWEQLSKYDGKKPAEAAGVQAEEAEEKIAKGEKPVPSVDGDINKATEEGEQTVEKCLAKPKCAEEAAANGGVKDEYPAIVRVLSSGILKKVVNFFSPLAALVPACLIYDGSLDSTSASEQLNQNSTTDQRAFYALETSADQQKYGDTNGSAVGAMSDKLGDISNSVAERRAAGFNVNTATQSDQAPQQSATGQFTSIADAIPGPFATFIDSTAPTACPYITNIWANIALGGLSLIPGFGKAAKVVIDESAGVAAKAIFKKLAEDEVGKVSFKNFAKRVGVGVGKFAGTVVGIGAATLFASWIVHHKLVATDTALATGPEFDDAADAGGNLNAQETSQLFYGRPLTNAEVVESATEDLQYRKLQLADQSFSQRYFQISNPNSLINHVAMDINAGFSRTMFTKVFSLIGAFLTPLNSLVHGLGSLNTQAVFAANNAGMDTQNYGILQWGWSNEEEQLIQQGSSTYPKTYLAGLPDPNTGVNYSYAPIENQDSYNNRAFCYNYTEYYDGRQNRCDGWANYNDYIPELFSRCFGRTSDGKLDENNTIADLLTQPSIHDASILRDKDTGDVKSGDGYVKSSTSITTVYDAKDKPISTTYVLDLGSIRIDDPPSGYCNPTELGDDNPDRFANPDGTGIPIDPPLGDIVYRYRLEMNYELVMDQLQGIQNSKSNADPGI